MALVSMSTDYDEIIHSAARDGDASTLETFLNLHPECINKVYEHGKFRWTVLIAACFFNHEHVVSMLLHRFKPDVEATGTVFVNKPNYTPQVVEGASSLWTAAVVNHFDIVQLLVEQGHANVNHLTEEQSSPIRAACHNLNLDMVQYLIKRGANPFQVNKWKHTCLMVSAYRQDMNLVAYFLDEIKCDINQQDVDGRTALYWVVRKGDLDMTKFLLERGALNIPDTTRKMTPLMRAAIQGKADLVTAFYGHCSELESIEARELLATAYAGCEPNMEDMNKAVEYLTQAFEMRKIKSLPKVLPTEFAEAFGHRQECETLEQFNQLVCSDSRDSLYLQALLIQERLLGTANKHYHFSLRYCGAVLADAQKYHACLRLWLYQLDLRRQHDLSLDKEHLRSFASMFAKMLSIRNGEQVPSDVLLKILTIVPNELTQNYDEDTNYKLLTLLYLITIAARLLGHEDVEQREQFPVDARRDLFKLIRSINQSNYVTNDTRSSLLHLCCNEQTDSLKSEISYPCVLTVRLLVDCGADVDAMDSVRNTPLHLLVRNEETVNTLAIIDILCDVGAHIDCVNDREETPLKSEYTCNIYSLKRLREKLGVTRLKCRCARLIKQRRLLFREHLSTLLSEFVDKH